MSWTEKKWIPLTIAGGLIGISLFAGKKFNRAKSSGGAFRDGEIDEAITGIVIDDAFAAERGCYPCPNCKGMMYVAKHYYGQVGNFGTHCSCSMCGGNYMRQDAGFMGAETFEAYTASTDELERYASNYGMSGIYIIKSYWRGQKLEDMWNDLGLADGVVQERTIINEAINQNKYKYLGVQTDYGSVGTSKKLVKGYIQALKDVGKLGAESFNAMSFNQWSQDEMNEELHGGRNMQFKEWLDDEVHTHGNIPLKNWGYEEENDEPEHQHAESRVMDEDEIMEHYVSYWEDEDDSGNIPLNYEDWKENHLEDLLMIMGLDAESYCSCDIPKPRHVGVHPTVCKGCDMIITDDFSYEQAGKKACSKCGKMMSWRIMDFPFNKAYTCDCGNTELEAESKELKKDSCCCGATKSNPCACMYQGVMSCSAKAPMCACYKALAEKKGADSFGAERIQYNYVVHREPKGSSKGGWFTSKKAESYGAESNFDKLADKVAADYEQKGYTKKEALNIGNRVAYSQGVKKYGKSGMAAKTKAGRVNNAESFEIDYFDLKAKLNRRIIDERFDIAGEEGRFYLTEHDDSEIDDAYFLILLDKTSLENARKKEVEIKNAVNNVLVFYGFSDYSFEALDEGFNGTDVIISKGQRQYAETFEAKGYNGISASKIKVLEKYIENGGQALDYHELPYHTQRQLEMGRVHELLYQDVNRWLQDNAHNPHHAMPSWLSAETFEAKGDCAECYGTGGLYDSHMGINDECHSCGGTGFDY